MQAEPPGSPVTANDAELRGREGLKPRQSSFHLPAGVFPPSSAASLLLSAAVPGSWLLWLQPAWLCCSGKAGRRERERETAEVWEVETEQSHLEKSPDAEEQAAD